MLHYLRIAVTALSLTACVLLIALWVRSYWPQDSIGTGIQSHAGELEVKSRKGWFHVRAFDSQPRTFGWPYRTLFKVPYLIPVFIAAALAIIPWMRWSKRFSLRTLLIATTLVAVGLGIAVAFS
jgi:hypothetical protein